MLKSTMKLENENKTANIFYFPLLEHVDERQNSSWFLQIKDQKNIRFYSERSLQREAEQIKLRLENLQKGETLLWIAPFVFPFAEKLAEIETMEEKKGKPAFALKNSLIWVSLFFPVKSNSLKTEKTSQKDKEKIKEKNNFPFVLLQDIFAWNHFVREFSGKEKFIVYVHPLLQKILLEKLEETNFSFADWSRNWLQTQMQQAALRLKTIQHFEKIWEKNFKHNVELWLQTEDVRLLQKPDVILLAGPSAEKFFAVSKNCTQENIWAADTIAGVCLQRGIIPQVVFSIDAGIASYEHFNFEKFSKFYENIILVMDVLSLPNIVRKKFKKKFSYAGTYPQAQIALQEYKKKNQKKFTAVENPQGNVGGFMLSLYEKLFGSSNTNDSVEIFGNDGGHIRFATHARGSAYHKKQYREISRNKTCEQYFYVLSKKYYPQE